ncbi:multidrug effflux MFS transporter [Oricola cellulosilytica]|uniref:Bcr/CflA family efflux transporter n=1 Tax=Oricola cellulosilytica TaxID=1429082 RepID=A0A4R0PAF1_9HYPH|nr:multidrug effflux MFS transporter [Oricola cellulosilytica]TCD11815.1 Bcr/CflA family efflux MFS transporter [Oricola cellulosilytica]
MASREIPVADPCQNVEWTGPRPSILTLVLLTAVSPLAINLFVPSMPSIAADLGAPYATVQLGLSLYLLMTAALQLVIGPLSDQLGRRPVIYAGMVLFLIGTAMCVFASNAAMFLAGRVFQAASASGLVLSRAIVRDVYPREKSASMIGYVVMGMAIAPMVGPAIGGFIDQISNWRMSFVALGAFGMIAICTALLTLPETNRFRGAPLRDQIASYRALLRLPLFWVYSGVAAFTSGIFFGFLGGGPAVSSVYLGLGPFFYGLYFAFCAFGYSVGNFLSGRFSERRGLERMMLDGALISVTGPLLTIVLFSAGLEHPLSFFLPLALVGVGNGMTLPNVTAAAIGLRPEAAGAASGLLGALQIGLGALASVAAGVIVGKTGLPIPLCLFLAACGLIAIGFTHQAVRMTRQA